MAAKAKYTQVKVAIGGGAVGAVILGAAYFAGGSTPTQASAVSDPPAAAVPAQNASTANTSGSGAAPAGASSISGTSSPPARPNATLAPRARKSRGS